MADVVLNPTTPLCCFRICKTSLLRVTGQSDKGLLFWFFWIGLHQLSLRLTFQVSGCRGAKRRGNPIAKLLGGPLHVGVQVSR
jgi:hypothetical protein